MEALAGLLLKWGGEAIVKLAVELIKQWSHDLSIRKDERAKMALAAYGFAVLALRYQADAAGRGDGGASLRVREGGGTVPIPSINPDAPSGAGVPPPDQPRG